METGQAEREALNTLVARVDALEAAPKADVATAAAAGAAHAATHVTGGGDTVADAVAAGASGLMSGADKTKLDGVAAGAEVNVNADWTAGPGDAEILNKPTLGAMAAEADAPIDGSTYGRLNGAWAIAGGGSYTDEQAQDAVGAMLDPNSLLYTDLAPLLEVKKQMSITSDASGIKLDGDAAAPGNGKVYGTNAAGVKGWQDVLVAVGLTGVLRSDAGVVSVDGDVTDVVAAASDAAAGKIELAIQAEMEAGTDVGRAVTPGRQHFHPSACKGWGKAAGAGTLTTGYNMDACTDTGVGRLGVNITTDISSANYSIVTGTAAVATTLTVATVDNGCIVYNASQAAGAFGLWNWDHTATTHAVQDPQSYFWAIFGDFA